MFRLVPFFALLLIAFPAAAEVIQYAEEQRYAVVDEDKGGDLNVVIREETYKNLPAYIRNQINMVAGECTGNMENAELIKAYSYVSENTRKKDLPPNYILDMSLLAEKKLVSCSVPKVCHEGQCALWGFKALEADEWVRGIALSTLSWTFANRPLSNSSSDIQTLILVKFETDRCEKMGGRTVDEDICEVAYAWTGTKASAVRGVWGSPN